MGGISVTQLLIIAVIVILLFGTKKLRGIGSDLGSAVKGFKKAMSEDDNTTTKQEQDADFDKKSLSQNSTQASAEQQTTKDKEQG